MEILEFLYLNVGTTPPFKILFNDIHSLTHELVLNCAHRQIGGQNGSFNLTLQQLVWDGSLLAWEANEEMWT